MHAKERIDGRQAFFERREAGMSNAVELLKPSEFHDVEVISPRRSPELTRPFRYLLDAMTEAKWHNCARQIRKGRQVIR
jgi:hypothetical protein